MELTDKKYTSNGFLKVFAISALVVLGLIALSCYWVDPFLQFRVNRDAHYILNPRFVNGGLAKNYEYNTALIGSSMVQSFDVSTLRNTFDGMEPVKLSSGGMNLAEMELVYSLVDKEKAKKIILNVDMPFFNQSHVKSRYPNHLYKDGFMDKLQYLFGYEALIQYLPADLGVELYYKMKGGDLPEVYKIKTSIDQIGSESYAKTYSAEFVKNFYLSGNSVLYQHVGDMEKRMDNSLESFITSLEIEKHKDIEYTFMFPSYSALYWFHTRRNDYYEQFVTFPKKFLQKVEKYNNVRVVFFMDLDEITNLDYYGDVTHFSPALADTIMKNMYNPKYEITSSNIDYRIHRVDSLVDLYTEKNKDWLPK